MRLSVALILYVICCGQGSPLSVNVYFVSHYVGQGLAPAVEINENRTAFGCYQIEIYIKHSAPSARELLSVAKLRE